MVREEIVRFALESPENRRREGGERYFDEPLVGYASAADPRGNCLYYRDGSCGICIDRCPAGALSRGGHDKSKCSEYVHGEIPRAVGERFQVSELGCGLCQTMVPCEEMIPRGPARSVPREETPGG